MSIKDTENAASQNLSLALTEIPKVALNRHGVILDYIELFVFLKLVVIAIANGIMYAGVYGQSRVDEANPE